MSTTTTTAHCLPSTIFNYVDTRCLQLPRSWVRPAHIGPSRCRMYREYFPHEWIAAPATMHKPFFAPLSSLRNVNVSTVDTATRGFNLFQMPPEILSRIILELDIVSTNWFSQANRQTRFVTTALPQYRQVVQHGAQAIKAMLRANLVDCFSYRELHRALIQEQCSLCGKFGGFLFLLTCTRCCYTCIHTASELAVTQISCLRNGDRYLLGLSRVYSDQDESHWETFKTKFHEKLDTADVRWMMVPDRSDHKNRLKDERGVSVKDMLEICRSIDSPDLGVVQKLESNTLRYYSKACIVYPWLDQRTMREEHGLRCLLCPRLPFPYHEKRQLVWQYQSAYFHYLQFYSENGVNSFQKHLESCTRAQELLKKRRLREPLRSQRRTRQSQFKKLGSACGYHASVIRRYAHLIKYAI